MGYTEMKKIGAFGELQVASQLIQAGYEVFRDMTDTSKIDLIVRVEDKLVRLQIKTCHLVAGGIAIKLYKKGRMGNKIEYTSQYIDVIAYYVYDADKIVYVASREIEDANVSSLSFRVNCARNNQKKPNTTY